MAFDIIQGAESPVALKMDFILMSSYCGSRLTPATNWSRVDQIVKELEIVEQAVDPKDVDIVILSGLTPQYDAKVRMLQSFSG